MARKAGEDKAVAMGGLTLRCSGGGNRSPEDTLVEASLRYLNDSVATVASEHQQQQKNGVSFAFSAGSSERGAASTRAARGATTRKVKFTESALEAITEAAASPAMDASLLQPDSDAARNVEDDTFKRHTSWAGLVFSDPQVERAFLNGHARLHKNVVYKGYGLQVRSRFPHRTFRIRQRKETTRAKRLRY